jgi:hypothetical protein
MIQSFIIDSLEIFYFNHLILEQGSNRHQGAQHNDTQRNSIQRNLTEHNELNCDTKPK